jgi:hypothetical protein
VGIYILLRFKTSCSQPLLGVKGTGEGIGKTIVLLGEHDLDAMIQPGWPKRHGVTYHNHNN